MLSRNKVMVYCFNSDMTAFLTFTQRGAPEAGRQIPAGTIESMERPHEAALREFTEETGYATPLPLTYVTKTVYDMSAYKPEIHVRHWYACVDRAGDLPEAWGHEELESKVGLIQYQYGWTGCDMSASLIAGHGDLCELSRSALS